MKGQAEIIIFLLLFIIGVLLFASATVWSRGIFQENVDFTMLESAERFMKDLDSRISDVIKFGGMQEIDYGIGGTIEIDYPQADVQLGEHRIQGNGILESIERLVSLPVV